MKNMDLKNKVLDEIISMMDDKEGDNLKKKSPKFMAMSVEVKKPDEKELPKELMAEKMDPSMEESEGEDGMEAEISPEMLKKLIEQLKG